MRSPHFFLSQILAAVLASPAMAQSVHLECKPQKVGIFDEALCQGDSRYCGRYFELNIKTKTIREFPATPESPAIKWDSIAWSDTHIEINHPQRVQKWPSGKIAYVVKTREILNRFNGELVLTYSTNTADDRYLPQEEALQIGKALGTNLEVAPAFGTSTYTCVQVTRKL
jgi:hypothetical protein